MSGDLKRKLIDRRVAGGGNRKESETLLEELIARHDGDNLAHALVYHGFGTARTVEKVIS